MTADEGPDLEELMESIPPEHCRDLLAAVRFGRLATVDDGRPRMVVLNHIVDGGDLYFRTRHDARLAELTRGDAVLPVVYEVDSAFPVAESGWSVMATGHLRRMDDEAHAERLRSQLSAWARGDRDLILHLEVHELSGRRVGRL
ncbi:MAG TPA: pyridoxamine 5'-phosphate oxidase family protein [Kineosporiaceae bacterium]|nr:pyridoxamine 5'-phosphate oxidase family protein [Kineosporiaceae bacterium]